MIDGVTGDAMLTPAYLSMPSRPNLDTFIRSASVCTRFSASALGYHGMQRCVDWQGWRSWAVRAVMRSKHAAGLIYNYTSLLPQAL